VRERERERERERKRERRVELSHTASLPVLGWLQVYLLKPWHAGRALLVWAALAQTPGTVNEERYQHFMNNDLVAEGRRQSPKQALWERDVGIQTDNLPVETGQGEATRP
jgi:hypothetical protein